MSGIFISCPICRGNFSKFFFNKEEHDYFRCESCGVVFIWPQPKSELVKEKYDQWGEDFYLQQDKIDLDFNSSFEERLNALESYRNNGRLLDVGCSLGAFLSAAKNRNWNVYGVELSHASAEYAKKVKGLNVFCGTLSEAGFEDEYFDVVNIWAVLEHVIDPISLLRESCRVLRKNGLLCFCVPNLDCLPFKLLGKKYRYMQDGHLFYFTKKSVVMMLNKFGFEKSRICSEYFSPLSFLEDLRGVSADTLRTQKNERNMFKNYKGKNGYFLIVRPIWKIFMFFVRKLYLAEELRVSATK
jgi:2-polyprenyl-3-methyl-5-hydroxy-6-metoxy-1,4-benzoquinol methylase